jgi:hypothetical protein
MTVIVTPITAWKEYKRTNGDLNLETIEEIIKQLV